jgi:transcriptional regulator with XRE-family HTH domain
MRPSVSGACPVRGSSSPKDMVLPYGAASQGVCSDCSESEQLLQSRAWEGNVRKSDPRIGEVIRSLRLDRGWSAQKLADECARAGMPSLTRGTLAKIEAGVRKSITLEEVRALAYSFGVEIDDLWDSQQSPQQSLSPRRDQGLIFVSIGGPSNRPTYERSLSKLNLENVEILGEYIREGYIGKGGAQKGGDALEDVAKEVRDLARKWSEDSRYSTLHLFYRGPVAVAPLLGRILAAAKPLVVYHYEDGVYSRAYTLDRKFIFSR